MIIGITGHRVINDTYDEKDYMHQFVKKELKRYFQELKPSAIISGMAIGSDTYAAEIAIELNIPFIAAIPFKGQELFWPKSSQERYHYLLSKASKVEIISPGGYAGWKMHSRNIWIVDNCGLLLVIYKEGSVGGTKKCMDYAKICNKEIKIISV
jgi:uncharacterized phage-like protein YoqJ